MPRRFIGLALLLMGLAAFPNAGHAQDPDAPEITNFDFMYMAGTQPRSGEYKSLLAELFKLGRYGLDPHDLMACKGAALKTLAEKASLDPALKARVDQKRRGLSPNEIWDLIQAVAMKESDLASQSVTLDHQNSDAVDAYIKAEIQNDAIITYLVIEAANEGHMMALNEVGSSQLYCYNGVKQDFTAALSALERASQQGDEVATMSLGKMYYSGLGTQADQRKGKRLEDKAFDMMLKKLAEQRRMDWE